ncbi:tubulin--tyrosine ligase, putative [Plasmodium relictum]|uniref:Tubulin--tyrosine ligase, putative n=1 Tax=Plasmodium relictum TaxID=85471 RepID=A0A1J1H5Y3_PLARL|nr:tubulin--tyrosine ligase, putative [Plasmodium relictum]CRH00342.1 tubulin--tyrosine ligase, putative [Plasmodium relictum]
MNSFHNIFNINYKNEINEYKKRNITKIVPTYSLKNIKVSKEYSNLKNSLNNNINDINEENIKNFKENKSVSIINDVTNCIDTSNKYSSTHAYKTNLNYASIKKNTYSNDLRKINNSYSGSTYCKNNYYKSNIEKVKLRNTNENEKKFLKKKQIISKDYLTKFHNNIKSKIENDNLLYLNKINNILYRNNDESKIDNNIFNFAESPSIRSSRMSKNLNNYKTIGKIKMEKSLIDVRKENKKVNSISEVNLNMPINKKEENKSIKIPLINSRNYDQSINFNSNNNIVNKIKHPYHFSNNVIVTNNIYQNEHVLHRKSDKSSKNENKNFLIGISSHMIFNDNNLDNLKISEKKCNSITYFNKNDIKEKNIKTNSSKIDNGINLLQTRIKSHEFVNYTNIYKPPDIYLKDSIKSEPYIEKPMNVNHIEYVSNYSDINLLQNNKYLTNSIKNDIINNISVNHYYKNVGDNYFSYKCKEDDHCNNENNVCNNNFNKISYNEEKSEKKRYCDSFKKYDTKNSNNIYEKANMRVISKSNSDNHIIKIISKGEIINKYNNISLYRFNEGDKKKKNSYSNCLVEGCENKNNKEINEGKPCYGILLDKRTKEIKCDILNQNKYFNEADGKEENCKLMKNKEDIGNVVHKQSYIENGKLIKKLRKGGYLASNNMHDLKNESNYSNTINHFELNKGTHDIQSCNNTNKIAEMQILNNTKNKYHSYNVNICNNNINYYNHNNDEYNTDKIYFNEIKKITKDNNNFFLGKSDSRIYDNIINNNDSYEKKYDKGVVNYDYINKINNKYNKNYIKEYSSDKISAIDLYDNSKNNEEDIMLNNISKNISKNKSTNDVIQINNAINYEDYEKEHIINNSKNDYKKSMKNIYLTNHNKNNFIILGINNDLKKIDDIDFYNKRNKGHFYNKDKEDYDSIKSTKRQISRNVKYEEYFKENSYTKPYVHYKQNLDNFVNTHKTLSHENKQEEEEKQEKNNNNMQENEKNEKKTNIYLNDVLSNNINTFIEKKKNTLIKSTEKKKCTEILEKNNLNEQKLAIKKEETFIEGKKKNCLGTLLKDNECMMNKKENEIKNKIDNDVHFTNKGKSNESFYMCNKKINDMHNIKKYSNEEITENNDQRNIFLSNPNYNIKNSKNNINDSNDNIKSSDNDQFLTKTNSKTIKCKKKLNSSNISGNEKKKNACKSVSNGNFTDIEYGIAYTKSLTDSYIYHLSNLNKIAKQRNKKSKLKDYRMHSKINEKDILCLGKNENSDLKKICAIKKSNKTDKHNRKENTKTYFNDNKNISADNSSKIKGKRSKSLTLNEICKNSFNNELIMLSSKRTKNINKCNLNIKNDIFLKEIVFEDNNNKINNNFENKHRIQNNKCSDETTVKNKESDICSTEKNSNNEHNLLSVSKLGDTCNDSINDNKNNVRINVINTNFDNIKNITENDKAYIHNCNDQSSLLPDNEIIGDFSSKRDDKKIKKVMLPWNNDNIVKLNTMNTSKKKKNITVNTKLARYERVLIHTCINKLNWKKCNDNINKGIFYWIGYNINDSDHYNYMKKKKIINRIPSIYMYTKKKALTFLLSHLSLIYPSLYDFYPNTFVLPENKNVIKYILNSNNKDYYIMKPDSGSMGIGVKLIHKYSDININILNGYNCYIIQKYIDNPLLMYKKKFDFRIYILLLPGKNYPKIYLSKIGFARLCTEEYKKKKRYICNTYVHLTNYSINKDNEKYIRKKNIHDKNNNKQLLSDVFIYLKNNGYDIDDIWKQIKKISCLTSLAIYSYIKSKIKYNFKNNFYFYQLVGLDILLDQTGKAWLLEVNSNPSLRIDYLDPNYTYFEIQLESMFDRYVKEPVISEMFLIVYKKIYKKYFKKKNKKIICINNKNEKSEKHSIICDNKIKPSKIALQNKPLKCSFITNNAKLKNFIENKKYPDDESSFTNSKNSYSYVGGNKISKTKSYVLNKNFNKNKIYTNNTKSDIKKKFSSLLYNSGSDSINNCRNNSLTNSMVNNVRINNMTRQKNKIKRSLFLKKENMSNIDTCVDENDIDSFSSSNNIDIDEEEKDNLLNLDKSEVNEHIINKSHNMNKENYEKNIFSNIKYNNSLNEPLNILKKREKIRQQTQEQNEDEVITNKNLLKFNNISKKKKKKNCLIHIDSSHDNIVNNNSKKNVRSCSNSDYSYDSYNSSVNFVGNNFINCFDDNYDNSIGDRDKNVSLNFPSLGTHLNNIDNKEIVNSESNIYNNHPHKSKDMLIESNMLNNETYVQIGNQEDIQFDKFLNDDIETYKSIYRNISDSAYKKKIENLITIRSNLYKYMNCLNVLGIRYINKDIGNFDDLYNKNISFDLKKTYTKIRKDILHPLKNNALEKNVYISLKKETSKFYDEMKIYNNCYFLFDFIIKKYDNNLKKKSNKFEYYIDKNTFLCMCKDIKMNKIIENIDIPTTTCNKFFEINKNSHENHMYQIIKEALKNKNQYKKERNKIYDENYSNNSNFLNNSELSNNNLSDETNCNDRKRKKGGKKFSLPHNKHLKNVDLLKKNQNKNENSKNNHLLNKNIYSNNSYYSTVFCPFSLVSTSNNLVNFNSIGINNMKYKSKRKKKMNVYDLEYLFTRQVSFSKYINKNQGLTLIDFFLLMQQLALLIFPYISYLSTYNSIYPYNSTIFEELSNQENNIFATTFNDKEMSNLKKNVKNIKKIEKNQDNDLKGKKENKCNMDKSTIDIKEVQEKKKCELNTRFNSEEIRKMDCNNTTNKQEEKKKDNYIWHKSICNNIYNLYEYIQIGVNPTVKNVCLETFLTYIFIKYGISYFS